MRRETKKFIGENCPNKAIRDEILLQAEVLEDMFSPLSKEQILYLCQLANPIQVSNAVRGIKMA